MGLVFVVYSHGGPGGLWWSCGTAVDPNGGPYVAVWSGGLLVGHVSWWLVLGLTGAERGPEVTVGW